MRRRGRKGKGWMTIEADDATPRGLYGAEDTRAEPTAETRADRRWRRARAAVLLVAAFGPLGGCASAGKLADYDFRDRTVGVVALNTPRPELLTEDVVDVNLSNPLHAALRIGADIVKEVEAARARPRLDSAAVVADVPGRMMGRVLHGVSGELRAVPVEDSRQAEFEVEVVVKRYGIDAEAWANPVHFFIESEVVLREAATGRRIWKGKVTEREPVTSVLIGWSGPGGSLNAPANDVITAAALATLSSDQMVPVLEALADFSADRVLRQFRKGLEKSRRAE